MAKISNKKSFTFCGYKFNSCLPGGMLIHPDYPDRWYDPFCANVTDNGLELHIIRDFNIIKHWDGKTYAPTYGVGVACSQEGFSYGKYEFVAKLPYGQYMKPNIWLTGVNTWPPEIDILEGYNSKTRKKYVEWPGKVGNPLLPSYKIETNVHYQTADNVKREIGGMGCQQKVMSDPTENFITYTLEWTPDSIKILYNNIPVRYVTDKDIPAFFNSEPLMYVLMTMNFCGTKTNAANTNSIPESKFIIKSFKYIPYEK